MQGIIHFKVFVFTVLMVNITPGISIVYVATTAMTQGIKQGVAGAFGIASGVLFYALLTAVGLAAIIAGSPVLFRIIQYAGAAYLLYLGIRSFMASQPAIAAGKKQPGAGSWSAYRKGLFVNLLNPLTILFFLSVLPQFVNVAQEDIRWPLLFLGSWASMSSAIVNALLAVLFGLFGSYLIQYPKFWVYQYKVTGILFILLAVQAIARH